MASGQFSSLLDVEILIPVGRNFNFLLKPVEEPVNWFTSLILLPCYLGVVHPLLNVALHRQSPLLSLLCFSVPCDARMFPYVISPSLCWSPCSSKPISWSPVCTSFCPSVVHTSRNVKKCAGHLDRQVLPFAGPNANLPVLACFFIHCTEKLCIFSAGHLDRQVFRTCRSKRKSASQDRRTGTFRDVC